jgi:hypothetical protein
MKIIPWTLPSTESSANVLQSQPTCIVQNVNENNPMDGGRIDILKYLHGVDLSDIFGEFKENRCVQNNIKSDTRTCMQSNPAVFNDCKFTIIQNLTINK